MSDISDWDWDNWTTGHPVKQAFISSAAAVRRLKLQGVGVLPARVRQADLDFLSKSQARLVDAMSDGGMERRLSTLLSTEADRLSVSLAAECAAMMGVHTNEPRPLPGDRLYVAGQFLAMTAGPWDNPVQAMLYAASQAAAHRALRRSLGEAEPVVTANLSEELRSTLGRDFVNSLYAARVGLPIGCHLEFGTASMQGWTDRLGSDLAVVVGTTVDGEPMYRVALLQAKWEDRRGTADVSQGGGEQLRRILKTGMGFYLFYPKKFVDRVFLPTVRSAEDVHREAHLLVESNYHVDVCRGDAGSEPAWDFAAFLAIAMTSLNRQGVGRLFPDVKSVCRALSEDRKHPLGSEVLYCDLTGVLKVHEFAEELGALGYQVPEPTISAPAPFDYPADDAEEDEAPRYGL